MPRKKVITGRRSSLQSSIWNYPDQVPGMSNVIQPLGQVHIYGAYLGHILLALFFKTLSLAIVQKTVLAFRLSWLAILLATVHASSSQANQRSRPSGPQGKKFPDMAQTIFGST